MGGGVKIPAELYDPATGIWTAISTPAHSFYQHTATLMPTGDVLLAQAGATELYNPCSDSFLVTDTLPASAGEYRAQAHLLHNNKVIYIGGAISINNGTTECYLYESGTWTATGSLNTGRTSFGSTILPTGEVVVCSGYNASLITSTEIYDPITETWTVSGTVDTPRTRSHSVLLPDGKVLMPGGNEFSNTFNSTEVFDPGMGYDTASVPVITSIAPSSIVISPSTVGYTALTITGTGFQDNNNRKGGEASNSGERNSASNYPIVQVSRIGGHRYDNDFTRYLPFDVDTGNYWDSTSTKVQFPHGIPNELPPGVYAVKVIANGIPSEPAYLNVEVACNVLADFETDTICEGDSTSFTDLSTGTPTSCWLYDFNDGDSAFSLEPVHLYDTAGFYSVTLVAHSLMGCVDTITKTVVVNPLPTVDAGSDSSICEGDSITLNGSGADSYTWTNGVMDGVAFIPPVGTTTYTVMGTDTNGCANIDSVVVTVNALPNVTANASPQIICEGDSSQLTGFGAVSYTWDNGVTDGDYVLPLTTTTYTVTGTDANNCVNTDSVVVTVNALPNVTANASAQTICIGDSSQLTGFGADFYTWDNGVTDSDYVSPITTTVYTVTGTDANNCVNTDSVIVTVNALPNVTANASAQTICEGDSSQLTGFGADFYTWDNGVTDSDYVSPITTTVYTVTGTNTNICMNTDSVVVTVNPLPNVTANASPQIICEGDSSQLTGFGAISYTWDNGVTNGDYVLPLTTTTYTVTGTDANICINTDSVVVTVYPLPNVTANASAQSICIGDSSQLTGFGADFYTWTNGVTDGDYVLPLTTTTYTVTGTDTNNCVNTDSVIVTVNALPNVTANASAQTICIGDSSQMTGSGTISYTWDNNVSDGDYVLPFTTTTYTVTGTDTNGCTSTGTVVVMVHENPSIASSYLNDSCYLAIGSVNLEVTGGNEPYLFFWSNGADTEDLSGLISGTYAVTVTENLGCTISETFIIQNILDCRDELWLPNIFSPNNDGLNDKLYVRGTEFATTFLFTIYNRWGEKVFETTNPQEGWDGTYRYKPLNTAAFAYLVSVTFIDGSEEKISGTVTLVR